MIYKTRFANNLTINRLIYSGTLIALFCVITFCVNAIFSKTSINTTSSQKILCKNKVDSNFSKSSNYACYKNIYSKNTYKKITSHENTNAKNEIIQNWSIRSFRYIKNHKDNFSKVLIMKFPPPKIGFKS